MTIAVVKEQPVSADVYDGSWVIGMGGVGSFQAFLESDGRNLRPRLARAMTLANIQPGQAVLDIGCGRGEIVFLSAVNGASFSVGVDYSTVPLSAARQAISHASLENLTTRIGLPLADAKKLPFRDDLFDRIFMLDIVEHLHDWELDLMLGEVRRVLTEDGYLVIHTLPNRWAIDYGYPLARLCLRKLPDTIETKRDIFHVNEQTVFSLSNLLRRNGFNGKVWLEDMMTPNALWLREMGIEEEGAQKSVYSILLHPTFRLLFKIIMKSPLRLLLANDLFAVGWKSPESPPDLVKILSALSSYK